MGRGWVSCGGRRNKVFFMDPMYIYMYSGPILRFLHRNTDVYSVWNLRLNLWSHSYWSFNLHLNGCSYLECAYSVADLPSSIPHHSVVVIELAEILYSFIRAKYSAGVTTGFYQLKRFRPDNAWNFENRKHFLWARVIRA